MKRQINQGCPIIAREPENEEAVWQDNNALKLMRQSFKGNRLTNARTLYAALTEMASDQNSNNTISVENIRGGDKSILEYSGLTYSAYVKARHDIESCGLIKTEKIRDNKGHAIRTVITILEITEEEDGSVTPMQKPRLAETGFSHLHRKPPIKFTPRQATEELKQLAKELDGVPGIYAFCGKDNEIFYIGKSTNLGRRVIPSAKRFINTKNHTPIYIKQIITPTKTDASLLETYFIAKHSPPFNVDGIFDDSPTVAITPIPHWSNKTLALKAVSINEVDNNSEKEALI